MDFLNKINSFRRIKNENIKLKKQKGITLIVLVITIIVLLILAGITIATTSSNSGILNKGVHAKRTAEEISNMSEINALIQEEKLKNGGKIDYTKFLSNTNKIVKFLNDLGYEYNNNGVFLAGTEALRIAENGNLDVYSNTSISTENNTGITAANSADKMYATNYRIYGNSVQDTTGGDPSPDNPVKIKSIGTINLLDLYNRTEGTLTGASNTTVRNLECDKYYIGLTANNYFNPGKVHSVSLDGDTWKIKSREGAYGINFPIEVLPNTTYKISGIIGEDTYKTVGFYDSQGNLISFYWPNTAELKWNNKFTTPDNCYIATIVFYSTTDVETTIKNVQVEEGDKATPYVSYGKVRNTNYNKRR